MDRNHTILAAIQKYTEKHLKSPEVAREALERIGIKFGDEPDSEEETFEYVVARRWDPDDPNSGLCIYSYHGEIQNGTMEDARSFLDYVRCQGPEKDYGIYRVRYERLD